MTPEKIPGWESWRVSLPFFGSSGIREVHQAWRGWFLEEESSRLSWGECPSPERESEQKKSLISYVFFFEDFIFRFIFSSHPHFPGNDGKEKKGEEKRKRRGERGGGKIEEREGIYLATQPSLSQVLREKNVSQKMKSPKRKTKDSRGSASSPRTRERLGVIPEKILGKGAGSVFRNPETPGIRRPSSLERVAFGRGVLLIVLGRESQPLRESEQ